ncbi:N-acetyltransferase B complex non catalytic subunit-domain-containing protein [Podospora didyma]|uniref:N-acetyltransferase B complex non catalytic subunit-domain-containing protein n=1 Tax=Podospora didyma TaxID=330526 RepID=A0AAE0NNR2_9PEZI|nr:N-acetyltransferase B complex non catalytic subunit-domain-containing protein [Podospora didyma]
MSSYARYGRPTLKNSVDLQLQNAFSDGNWSTVIRLADKRAKTLKDPYYEAIKISAESQLDGAADKCAVLVALDDLVRQKAVPDADTLELYEWAAQDFLRIDLQYAEAIGPLRARWVKANPKNPFALQCLQACLEFWDLVSAQQIAATLDKAYAKSSDRKYMFWSITLTFLLSISTQCTDASRKIYCMLVLKQLERAADITENSSKVEPQDRGLLTEEEICLYYRVLLVHGTKSDFITRMQSPRLGAISQLREGHKLLLWETLDTLEGWAEWDHIYDLCREALNLGIDGVTHPFLVCDWRVWKRFATAASKARDSEAALGEVQSILKKFIAMSTGAPAMYKKNISLALLETTFRIPAALLSPNSDQRGLSPRVIQIGLFLDQYFDKLSAFDDVKDYVAELTIEEVKSFLEHVLPKILDEKPGKLSQITLKSLEIKLRYLLTTCPQTLSHHPTVVDGQEQHKPYQCRLCSNLTSFPCEHCLNKIIISAADTYGKMADSDLGDAIPHLDKDPRLDLALVMGLSLLKLAGLQPRTSGLAWPPLQGVKPGLFFQAVLLLDTQLQATPSDSALRLLLVQLYLLLGCTSYAYQLWQPMDVKRTIQDALSPLFFDRISTLSPGLFQGTRPLMDPLRSYYGGNLRDNCPVRIWDAFSSGSYTSIIDISEYDSKLRRSCTLMMTMVEERRATRCFGGKLDYDIDDHPLAASISDSTTLTNKTDYGSFPHLESLHGAPIQEFVRLGPELSNTRSHLSFLSEQYLDLLSFKPPKDYRPAKANEAALRDRTYIDERLAQLNSSLADYLHQPSTPSLLTGAELSYYTLTSMLAAVLLTSLTIAKTDSAAKTPLSLLSSSIRSALTGLRTSYFSSPNPAMSPTCFSLTNMHILAQLREAAVAAKHTAAFALTFHDKELARDRSGKSGLHRDAVAEMKALEMVAGKMLQEVKTHVQKLKESLGRGGWLDRMLDWIFGGDESGEDDQVKKAVQEVVNSGPGAEDWVGRVLESWRETVKGWGMVRME